MLDRSTPWPYDTRKREPTTEEENLDHSPGRLGTGTHWWVGRYPPAGTHPLGDQTAMTIFTAAGTHHRDDGNPGTAVPAV